MGREGGYVLESGKAGQSIKISGQSCFLDKVVMQTFLQ